MIDENDTRWVRLWRTWRGKRNPTETYERLSHIGSDEEAALRDRAEEWGTQQGPASSEFQYGFEIVDKPPREWIAEKINSLKKQMIWIVGEIEDLVELTR